MQTYELVLILCLFSLLAFLTLLMNRNYQKQLMQKDRIIQNLLDRLTSGDLKTYQIMSRITSSASETEIPAEVTQQSMSDEAELKRIAEIHGLGEPIWDEATDPEELKEFLGEMGVEYGTNPPN